jgi:uncharacterized protein (DUF952 family)
MPVFRETRALPRKLEPAAIQSNRSKLSAAPEFAMGLIFKIIGAAEWRQAEKAGVFAGAGADLTDGYIHFSTAAQAPETASKWFAGRADLVLAAVDADTLGAALRWEPSRGGALFPHLYAQLPLSAVRWTRALPLGADGRHVLGSLEA